MSSNRQKYLIEKKDWNCLIILDACRYDFFESNYDEYLNGKLRKVISEGTNTSQWLKRTFQTSMLIFSGQCSPYQILFI
ncbi:hypothetical protein AKJ64_01105 [candidate division MSBL1 archaeon SCGC-AAA259E17]|uniref:Uncharacterized protein n=1 Tax=candidate division MSBL1 archaeon SCGC-AAA259E17 TaxID=1698263 RepID=A0A133UGD5_9EURY|nr:hypothetical protein AKJ64_01105 [candidate division MSBL1 archaeon SCGC-AAA259E17]